MFNLDKDDIDAILSAGKEMYPAGLVAGTGKGYNESDDLHSIVMLAALDMIAYANNNLSIKHETDCLLNELRSRLNRKWVTEEQQ